MLSYSNVSTLYVSQKNGSVNNTGVYCKNDKMMNGPLPTIELALVKVAQMRRAGYTQPLTIKLLDEEYHLSETINLGKKPKANLSFPIENAAVSDITIEPFCSDKKVLISGAKKLYGFVDDSFNGVKCWSIELEEVRNGAWSFSELYVNGKPANRTRYPHTGFLYPQEVEKREWREQSSWFIAKDNDIPNTFKSILGAKIRFRHFWIEEQLDVASYDFETRKCVFDGRTSMNVTEERNKDATMEYFIENLAEAFGREGDFYLDKELGKLYYLPLNGQTKENTEIYAPVIDKLIVIDGGDDGVQGIRFKNIKFAYTKGDYQPLRAVKDRAAFSGDSNDYDLVNNEVIEKVGADYQCSAGLFGAVEFKNAHHCSVNNCEFVSLGGYGVKIMEGCHHILVENCKLHYLGGGGVSIGGGNINSAKERWTHDIKVNKCDITKLGQRYLAGCGILLMDAYDCELTENEIHDFYYSGICLGWVWGYAPSITHGNIVRKNHIYDLGKGELSDMGGVYTLGRQDGTIVSENVIHDIKSRDYGGWALYADEGSQNIVFENNLCYNVSQNCFHQHYGRMNVVRNNVFANADEALIKCTHKEAQAGVVAYNNVFLPNEKPVYFTCSPLYFATDNNVIYANKKELTMLVVGEEKANLDKVRKEFLWDTCSEVKPPIDLEKCKKLFLNKK